MSAFNQDSIEKGRKFEEFVQDTLFPKSQYNLLEKTHTYEQNSKRFVESSKHPDFKFKSISTGHEFYVEAKYRQGYNNNDQVSIMPAVQFKRFFEINKEIPILVVIGIGGTPQNPELVSLIPFTKIDYLDLFKSVIYNHRIDRSSPYEFKQIDVSISGNSQRRTW